MHRGSYQADKQIHQTTPQKPYLAFLLQPRQLCEEFFLYITERLNNNKNLLFHTKNWSINVIGLLTSFGMLCANVINEVFSKSDFPIFNLNRQRKTRLTPQKWQTYISNLRGSITLSSYVWITYRIFFPLEIHCVSEAVYMCMGVSESRDNKTQHLQQGLTHSEGLSNVLWSFILHLPLLCLYGGKMVSNEKWSLFSP